MLKRPLQHINLRERMARGKRGKRGGGGRGSTGGGSGRQQQQSSSNSVKSLGSERSFVRNKNHYVAEDPPT